MSKHFSGSVWAMPLALSDIDTSGMMTFSFSCIWTSFMWAYFCSLLGGKMSFNSISVPFLSPVQSSLICSLKIWYHLTIWPSDTWFPFLQSLGLASATWRAAFDSPSMKTQLWKLKPLIEKSCKHWGSSHKDVREWRRRHQASSRRTLQINILYHEAPRRAKPLQFIEVMQVSAWRWANSHWLMQAPFYLFKSDVLYKTDKTFVNIIEIHRLVHKRIIVKMTTLNDK